LSIFSFTWLDFFSLLIRLFTDEVFSCLLMFLEISLLLRRCFELSEPT